MSRHPFSSLFGRLSRDRRGNVVILFALSLVPLLGILGLTVDFSLELRAKTTLDASLDAAVLAAAAEAEQIIQSQSTASYDATPVAISYGQIAGQQVFTSNSARARTTGTPALTLNLQRAGLTITANGSYTSQSATTLGKMFGTSIMKASGKATATLNLPKYMKIYMAYDISQSMGIASTDSDMSQMKSAIQTFYSSNGRTPQNSAQANGCVFGCHVSTTNFQNSGDPSFETIGHNAGVKLRIDDVKQSIGNIISSAVPKSGDAPTISVGLYSLQHNQSPVYDPATNQPSTNYTALTAAANGIDLGPNDNGGTGDSDLATSLQNLVPYVSASGDGSGVNSQQSFVFIITDGVSDVAGNCTDGHCTKAFDPSWCAGFKSKGATVGVIYTTYIPFPNEQTYVDLVQPFASQISYNLQYCASPGYYYEASDGPAIQAAARALFAQATSSSHLTR